MNVMGLCAGIGGLELGLHLAEPRANPVVFVEQDEFCRSILQRRWPGALIWDNVLTFDGRPWRRIIDVLTGGFPCQPWSLAGERKGTEDERWIFPQIGELIRQVEPEFVFLENVPALIAGGGLALVLGTLAELGYDAVWGVFSCEQLGAAHKRQRVFILAHSKSLQCRQGRPAPAERPGGLVCSREGMAAESGCGIPSRFRIGPSRQTPLGYSHRLGGRGDGDANPGHPEAERPGETVADPDCHGLHGQPSLHGRDPALDRPGEAVANGNGFRGWGTLWERKHETGRRSQGLADGDGERLSVGQEQYHTQLETAFGSSRALWAPGPGADWGAIPRELWPSEQPVRGMVDGLPARVEFSRRARVKALGNAVSPPVGAIAWRALKARLNL